MIDPGKWIEADYEPLPTLVAAARSVFQHEPLPHIRRAKSVGIPGTIAEMIKITMISTIANLLSNFITKMLHLNKKCYTKMKRNVFKFNQVQLGKKFEVIVKIIKFTCCKWNNWNFQTFRDIKI